MFNEYSDRKEQSGDELDGNLHEPVTNNSHHQIITSLHHHKICHSPPSKSAIITSSQNEEKLQEELQPQLDQLQRQKEIAVAKEDDMQDQISLLRHNEEVKRDEVVKSQPSISGIRTYDIPNLASMRHTLYNLVDDTKNAAELLALLSCLDLNTIKTAAHAEIEQLDACHLRSAYHKSLPMDAIIPEDLTRKILAFGGLYHTKGVSKKWKFYSEQNKKQKYTEFYASICDQHKYSRESSSSSRYIVVDKNRTELYPVEQNMGCIGPINDIKEALNLCNENSARDRNKIFIHGGVYQLETEQNRYLPDITKNTELIAVDNEAIIQLFGSLTIGKYGANKPIVVKMKGITLQDSNVHFDDVGAWLYVTVCGRLFMEDCTVNLNHAPPHAEKFAYIGHSAFLSTKNCTFQQGQHYRSVFEIAADAKSATITNCVFQHARKHWMNTENVIYVEQEEGFCGGRACIMVEDEEEQEQSDLNDGKVVSLQCENNVFCNMSAYPFAESTRNNKRYLHGTTSYALKQNVCAGYESNIDANKLYVDFNDY
mmetsp:Transcript_13424/g.21148  ORF Transcript_13424/g.21148 Transcript_13424/m.21148 type:complete len:540 (-) Transcript_13424:106-1725(-)